MAAIINTNVGSLNAQRNLSMSQTALATAMQRLSSGLRINSAKDDAAGLAISERFSTQIRGLNQAVRNANDGISLSQTAEGALNTISDNLQRIRELSVQSANATNSASDRAALDAEVQQRLAEVDRVAKQTNFNGQRILDGTFGSAAFQVGANVGQTINVNLGTSMKLADVGAIASATSTENVTGIIDGTPATFTTAAANIVGTDYSTAPATAGTSTIQVTTAAADTDTIDINGVTFTFAQGGTPGIAVTGQGAVTITRDMTGTPLTADTTADALNLAIAAYKADSNAAYSELDDITATVSTDTVTLTYATAGLPSTNGNTIGAASGTLVTTNTLDATGSNADTSANSDFVVQAPGGSAITIELTTDLSSASVDDLLAVIQADSDYATAGWTVTSDGTNLTFTADDASTGTFTMTGGTLDPAAITDGDVPGAAGTPITVAGNFSITVGDANPVNVADGTYTTAQDLVDAINGALGSTGFASLNDDGTLSISSAETITVTGTTGLTTLGLPASTTAAGDLSTVNVLTVAGANDAMQRVDAALTAVNNLRADFGAIQNRFESTISNLTTTAENLTASRSRIMDADFAQETAALSRAQILQQAGTAMVAQANQLPQGVLALLR